MRRFFKSAAFPILLVVILGLVVPGKLGQEKRLALIGTAFLVLALWAIAGQAYSLMRYPTPGWMIDLLSRTNHPLRLLWGIVFLLTTISVTLPLVFIIRKEKFKSMVIEIFDRISTLSSLYVFFDLVGILIITVRNLQS